MKKKTNRTASCAITMWLLFFGLTGHLNAQNFGACSCGGGQQPIGVLQPTIEQRNYPPTDLLLKIYVHALGDDQGYHRPSDEDLKMAIANMQTYFAEHLIKFQWDEMVIPLNSSQLYAWNNLNGLCSIENYFTEHTDGIDIIIGGEDAPVYGIANGIPGDILLIKGTETYTIGAEIYTNVFSKGTALAHEMGHCLGLWHTFHGSEGGTNCNGMPWDPEECLEKVDSSNSTTCGDYVADTPADVFPAFGPINSLLSDCDYYWQNIDPNGQLYTPATDLIMSYWHESCKSRFTLGQGERMRQIIDESEILQACTIAVIGGLLSDTPIEPPAPAATLPTALPNPASEQVVFTLPEGTIEGSVRIFGTDGRLVTTLTNAQAGQFIWHIGNTPNGVYLYQMTVRGQAFSGRIMVQK